MSPTWRLARSLETLRSQIDEAWPERSIASDGSIGDTSHQASKSDHNPVNGIVHAIDVTNDPPHECHAALICEAIRAATTRTMMAKIKRDMASSCGDLGRGSQG